MNFTKHSELVGKHAIFGASKYNWLNYSEEKVFNTFINNKLVAMGTACHEFSAGRIKRRKKLPNDEDYILDLFEEFLSRKDETKWLANYMQFIRPDTIQTMMHYVNDSIGFKMESEVPLVYSDNFFGTTDSICFRRNMLRIHDLKTGLTPAHIEQLMIYASLFCLEYKKKPADINIELRIYQNDGIIITNPSVEEIVPVMDKIVTFDKIIRQIKDKEGF